MSMSFLTFFDRLRNFGMEFFGLYYGHYRAVVVSIEDEERGLIRIRVPAVGDPATARRLAYPIYPFAGNGYGLKMLPPIGDKVYVVFENGRPDMPLWIGGWWRDGKVPSDLSGKDKHGWITPGGHKVLLDETSGGEKLRLEHKNGALIEIDTNGGIKITNKAGQSVWVGGDATEAAVLGDTLKSLLEQLIIAIEAITVPTPAGTSGTPLNIAQFEAVKAQLQRFLSQTVKVK